MDVEKRRATELNSALCLCPPQNSFAEVLISKVITIEDDLVVSMCSLMN